MRFPCTLLGFQAQFPNEARCWSHLRKARWPQGFSALAARAGPDEPSHRHLIYDNDSIFSAAVTMAIERFPMSPKRTAFRSPWQNGMAERWVGSVRRELLDHVIVLNEDHLRRLLREYVDYYNDERVHTSPQDSPAGRPVESRSSPGANVFGLPRIGGLHHRYAWRKAS